MFGEGRARTFAATLEHKWWGRVGILGEGLRSEFVPDGISLAPQHRTDVVAFQTANR